MRRDTVGQYDAVETRVLFLRLNIGDHDAIPRCDGKTGVGCSSLQDAQKAGSARQGEAIAARDPWRGSPTVFSPETCRTLLRVSTIHSSSQNAHTKYTLDIL